MPRLVFVSEFLPAKQAFPREVVEKVRTRIKKKRKKKKGGGGGEKEAFFPLFPPPPPPSPFAHAQFSRNNSIGNAWYAGHLNLDAGI